MNLLSRVRLFATPWTVACQVPSIGFSRQEYWSGLLFHSPGDLPNPGIKPRSPTLPADSLPSEPPRKPKNTGVRSLPYNQEIFISTIVSGGLTCGLTVKNLPAMQKLQETRIQSLGPEGPMEEGVATHSIILAWRILVDRGAWWAYSPWGRKQLDN